jgi:multiple sugar transport system substrate-binding protein
MQKINSPQQRSQKRPRLLALFAVTLATVLLLFILPALTQQPVVLTMLMQSQDIVNWKPFVKEFEQKNPAFASTS